MGEAAEIIKRGDAAVMFAGGAEAAIVPIGVAGFVVRASKVPREPNSCALAWKLLCRHPMVDVQQLVERARRHDRVAFGELYECYYPRIRNYISYHLSSAPDAADDLAADVFLRALLSVDRFEFREAPFTSWLYRIAHNRVVDYVRRNKRQQQAIALEDAQHLLYDVDRLDAGIDRHIIGRALAQVTYAQRQVVLMRVVHGFSIAETAHAVGRSEDSVKQLQSRGLKALRRVLEEPRPSARSA
ncbi:MAG: sigma-70 family RNA polymerase sigma factor [Chloroflexota bacterium]